MNGSVDVDETVEYKSYLVAAIGVVSSISITRLPTRFFGPYYLGPFEFIFQFFAFFVPIGIVSFSLASLLVKASTKELTVAERHRYLFYILTNSLPIISVAIKRILV
jgi:hypothetical protein